jgi:hypothetical protein
MKTPFEQLRKSILASVEDLKEFDNDTIFNNILDKTYYYESTFRDHIKVAYRIGKIEGQLSKHSEQYNYTPDQYFNEKYGRESVIEVSKHIKNCEIILNNLEPTSELFNSLQILINKFK